MTPRERLLEAAISCLQDPGWAKTTTREIVARADMHVPSVNYYFGTKDTLLHDAAVEALRRWGATTMDAVEATPSDPAAELRRSLERFLETLAQDRRYVVAAVEAFAQAERDAELRARLAEAYGAFRAVVVERISPGATPEAARAGGAEALASVLIALFDGLAIQRLLAPDDALGTDQILSALAILAAAAPNNDATPSADADDDRSLTPQVQRDPERGRAAAAKLKALGAKAILIKAAEQGYITQLACKMPECFCPEELGGACYFDAVTAELSDWMPTHEHFPISKRDGGRDVVGNAILAHRLCNRIDYSISVSRSYERDLKRIKKAREDAIRGNNEGPD